MKYLTKEWYIAWRRAGISRGLRPDPLAEQFSEAHYKKVYDEELRRYIASFEPLDISTIKKIHEEEFKQAKKVLPPAEWQKYYDAMLAWQIKTWHDEMKPFGDAEKQQLTDEFIDWQRSKIEICQTLPDEIKAKIADIRLLALGYASQEVINILNEYCAGQEEIVDEVEQEVKQRNRFIEVGTSAGMELKQVREENPDIQNCDSIDDQLRNELFQKITWEGTTLRIDFEEISLIIPEAKILEYDELIIGAGWFEYELYRQDNRIQFQMLAVNFDKGGSIPVYFSVEGADIQFSEDSPSERQ